ncbi:hypothetical protein COT68_02545 [bacterium (Candidatus Torokbacteria) CG09_land_8_20_14_0_10_42_11]|nr:MAG: hypothetical protein COT68_02545 [bacterium (Candidatus Torokbacteria) CG09_land_8_20_14_0_10_42_11]
MFKRRTLEIKSAKLLISNPKTCGSLCNAFIFEPERGKEKLGRLLILIKLEDSGENREIAQGIVEIVKNEFYGDPEKQAEESLEASLIKINETLKELAALGKVSWINKLDAVIACLLEGKLILSQTGQALSVLIRGGETNFITEEEEDQKSSQPLKTFSGLTCGSMEANDHLIIATASLFEFFSPAKLTQILSQANLADAKDYLSSLIGEQQSEDAVGAILISLKRNGQKEARACPAAEKISAPPEEMAEMIETAEAEEAMSERIELQRAVGKRLHARRRKKFPFAFLYSLGNMFSFLGNSAKICGRFILQAIKFIIRYAFPVAKWIARQLFFFFRFIAKKLFRAIASLFSKKRNALANIPIAAEESMKAPGAISSLWQKILQPFTFVFLRLQAAPIRQKIIFASLILILISSLFGAVLFKNRQAGKPQIGSNDAATLAQAEEKRKQALDAMIYQDENKARQSLEEADALVGKILGSATHREQARSLKNSLTEQFDQINHITRLDNPLLLFNAEEVNPAFNPLSFVDLKNNFYLLCENNVILRFDPEKKETTELSPSFANIGRLNQALVIDQEENILFTNTDNNFALFNLSNFKIEQASGEHPFNPNNIQDFAEYLNKVYALNPSENQIVKYSRSLSGLGKGALWLASGDIRNGVSLAVDGDVYLLTGAGKILKFRAGKEIDFPSPEFQPALALPLKIFTKVNYKNLYILDSGTKRVIVVEKNTGNILRQFAADQFENLKDLFVSQDEKIIYVLAGKKIFEIEN